MAVVDRAPLSSSGRTRPHGAALGQRILLAAVLVACAMSVPGLVAPGPAASASLPVRLEAGPQAGVRFDADWHVTSRRSITLATPRTETATSRRTEPPEGTWLHLATGPLAGRWVRESATAYVAGFAGVTVLKPARHIVLSAGTWELYRFGSAGEMTDARGWSVALERRPAIDRRAVVRGVTHVRLASGPFAGWWVPGTIARPQPVRCTAGGPPAPTGPIVVRAQAGATGEIALTFDMGGRLTPALSIVQYLVLTRTCATIFPTGSTASTETGRAVLAQVAAHPELFEVGNHTVHHCNLRDGGGGTACPDARPDAAFVTAELQDADAVIAALAGRHTQPYWRPPYGAADAQLRGDAAQAGYPVTVMWSIDTIDWRTVDNGGPTAAQTAATVIARREAGAVVLMHLGGWTTRDALPAMIAGLRAASYTPTSVSALFRAGS